MGILMSKVGDGIEKVRTKLDAKAAKFMADNCDIILLASAVDDSGGSGDTPSTVAADVPCGYKALKVPVDMKAGGKTIIGLTHQITLPSNAYTQAILPKHKIVVDARGNTPAMTFQDPVVLPDSLGPFVIVNASLGVQ